MESPENFLTVRLTYVLRFMRKNRFTKGTKMPSRPFQGSRFAFHFKFCEEPIFLSTAQVEFFLQTV